MNKEKKVTLNQLGTYSQHLSSNQTTSGLDWTTFDLDRSSGLDSLRVRMVQLISTCAQSVNFISTIILIISNYASIRSLSLSLSKTKLAQNPQLKPDSYLFRHFHDLRINPISSELHPGCTSRDSQNILNQGHISHDINMAPTL